MTTITYTKTYKNVNYFIQQPTEMSTITYIVNKTFKNVNTLNSLNVVTYGVNRVCIYIKLMVIRLIVHIKLISIVLHISTLQQQELK